MNRVAFAGASGTGKSMLATNLAAWLKIPINPVGSRSVAEEMGFASPYDVDKAGMRAEFQQQLIFKKLSWEFRHGEFVTDRTLCDNLAYTVMHDVSAVTDEMLDGAFSGMGRYTHVIYCPVDVFCNRIQSVAYHRVFDSVLMGLVDRWLRVSDWRGAFIRLKTADRAERLEWMRRLFHLEET